MATAHSLFEKDRTVTASDGTTIAYTVRGSGRSGRTVVLANGWSCSDSWWAELVPFLEDEGHRVVLPDTRGHGESGLPRRPGRWARHLQPEDVSVDRLARDLHEVGDAEGVERAVFVGHSMGVQTILEAYRQRRDRVEGLVGVAGAYENPLRTFYGTSVNDGLFPLVKTAVRFVPPTLLAVWPAISLVPDLGRRVGRAVRAVGPKITTEALAPYLAHLGTRDPAVLLAMVSAMRDHSAADVLPTIDVPVLILAGKHDTFTPLRCQKRMHDLTPGSELRVFDEAGHCLPLEEPEALNAAIGDFVAAIATSTERRAAG